MCVNGNLETCHSLPRAVPIGPAILIVATHISRLTASILPPRWHAIISFPQSRDPTQADTQLD